MSQEARPQLAGALSTHARGKTLSASFGAVTGSALPDSGALFVLGTEFQGDSGLAATWVDWATSPGRVLVVLPPFAQGECPTPSVWEARSAEALAGGETELGRMLARERRHEIRGRLLPIERSAGQVVTAGWRKHPSAGLVAVTTLPLWSLSALDHGAACREWLAELLAQAGQRVASTADAAPVMRIERVPTQDEWTFLLHLCTGPFKSSDDAMDALTKSTVHHLSAELARNALKSLGDLGYAANGALTDDGERALLEGPYSAFARALRRQHER